MSDDLARDVLVHWALPLLARARRCADDPARTSQWAWETLADDIAALIGHPVTDQPPAPELDEVLARADLPPVREKLVDSARLGTAEHFQAARNVARSAAPKKEQEAPARPLFGGRPYACDGCGARPDDGVVCLAPDGRHTWRPLPAPDAHPVHASARHDRPAHTLAPCPTDGAPCIRWCPGRQRCAAQAQASMSRESAPRTPLPEAFAPHPPRCPTCGARP